MEQAYGYYIGVKRILLFLLYLKGAVRAFPAKTSWGTTRPLIGQAAHGRRAGIILLTAWQIRGRVVPHEVLAGNALTSPFYTWDGRGDNDPLPENKL